jgi:hypothetical protein
MKRTCTVVVVVVLLLLPLTLAFAAGGELAHHPRIHKAFVALDGAIEELRAAPHDFGGHKAEALEACQRAKEQLRLALAYRAGADRH